MNFLEAVEELKKDKKIKREYWNGCIIINDIGCLEWEINKSSILGINFHIKDIEANDWISEPITKKCPHCNGTGVLS